MPAKYRQLYSWLFEKRRLVDKNKTKGCVTYKNNPRIALFGEKKGWLTLAPMLSCQIKYGKFLLSRLYLEKLRPVKKER